MSPAELAAELADIRLAEWRSRAEAAEAASARKEYLLTLLSEAQKAEGRHVIALGECFTLSGADPDGNDWRHTWDQAVRAVGELRVEHDATPTHDARVKALEEAAALCDAESDRRHAGKYDTDIAASVALSDVARAIRALAAHSEK